jgi:hypothetical protein
MDPSRILCLFCLLLLSACKSSKQTVEEFLDAVISGKPYEVYLAPGVDTGVVTSYKPVSYEVKNASDSEVSVLIVYQGTTTSYRTNLRGNVRTITGRNRTDMPETHVFTLAKGKITNIR